MFDELNLKSTYSTYNDDIANDFYTPVLSDSLTYDRATAYFSTKALANYAQGLELFAKNGHKYRLIISTEISETDYSNIIQGYELRDKLKEMLLSKLEEEVTVFEKFNLSNLAHLIALGIIDIKMAFTKQGIFHDKFGIMKDKDGNIICFRGSNNETEAAFKVNYESFDITCSWQSSSFDYSKITSSIETFEQLWSNNSKDIIVRDVDNIIKQQILKYDKGEIIYEPVLLEENCLILDYCDNLLLYVKTDISKFLNSPKYKMKIKRYVEYIDFKNNEIYFKKTLTYTIFQKIIGILENDTKNKPYDFFTTKRLREYIKSRQLYIKERSKVGLAIKQQDESVIDKFIQYKKIVDDLMYRKLRDKQMWDSFFMCTMKKSSNFSVPGSGKTSAVLGVFAYLNYKSSVDKIIMIGPKNSFGSWIDEFQECFNNKKILKVFNIQDYSNVNEKKREIVYGTENKNLLLFNYESLDSILNEVCKVIDSKTLLVFDEVHKVKAINGQRAENALKVSKKARYIITMTGTPIPNSYTDIKNILNICYSDEYNDFFGFTDGQLKKPDRQDIEEINSKLQPFFCRTTKKELSVPPANTDIFLSAYSSEIENEIFKILCMKYAKNKLALIIRLLQLESNPKMLLKAIDNSDEDFSKILYTLGTIDEIDYKDYSEDIIRMINSIDKTAKFEKCIEKAIELYQQGKPSIIWCIFVDSIFNLKKELENNGLKVGIIYGSIDNDCRTKILEKFKSGKLDVLITNPHTLAESVSLHKNCHDAIYFEYSYNLVHLLQSKDRIHRLGLPDNQYTQYYYLQQFYTTVDDELYSLDNRIYERLFEKETIMLNAIENNILESVTTSEEDLDIVFKDLGI